MDDPLQLGIYILLLLPGFIWVQTFEHHLLREKKEQFVKTLEIILFSALIWIVAYALPFWWPYSDLRKAVLNSVIIALKSGRSVPAEWNPNAVVGFFLTVCGWTFVVANIWGILRKDRRVDARIKRITGRDWYPSVAFRFYFGSIKRASTKLL